MMGNSRDRILIVENDPAISDLIGRQALQAAGHLVTVAHNAAEAVARAMQNAPSVIIADLNLPGLNCKDLLIALNSQGITAPVIVLANKGQEATLVQTFRLGAADFLLWPAREAEIITAVERLLKQTHEREERDRLAQQLQQANNEMQQRVRELTTIYSIGKAVTTVIDQASLFEKILDGAASVAQAELGWLLVKDENNKSFLLAAHRNLPPALASQANQPLDEGISSLVSMSGESLSIHGEALRKFKVSALGQSALVSPIKVQKQVIGLLVMMRKQDRPFSPSEQSLLESLTDFASISLVNARLFRTVEERARALQSNAAGSEVTQKIGIEVLQVAAKELLAPVERSRSTLTRLMKDPAWWSAEQRQMLTALREEINRVGNITTALSGVFDRIKPNTDLKELVEGTVTRFQPIAKQSEVVLLAELPGEMISAMGRPEVVSQILDGLVSNAIKFSRTGGKVTIYVETPKGQEVHLSVTDTGAGMNPETAARIFEKSEQNENRPRPFGGIGIRLPLIHEIIASLHGKIWVESKPEQGASFHITLPIQKPTRNSSG